jgi:PAS domain S-box-containing protein
MGHSPKSMMKSLPEKKAFEFLAGGGEMGERMRALDWSRTPLGPVTGWPQSLKTIIRVMLDSRYAMWMLWGPDLTFFCNDAYLPTVGMKRDWVLGSRSDKVWEEIWSDIGPRIQRVLEDEQATWDEGLPLFLERYGFKEETYHTFSYSPIYDDDSRIAGMLCVVTEVTDRVIGERRLGVLRDLAACPRAETTEEACKQLIGVLAGNPFDVVFASLYLVEPTKDRLVLAQHFGDLPNVWLPQHMDIGAAGAGGHGCAHLWPIGEALDSGKTIVVDLARSDAEPVSSPLWPDRIRQALAMPIRQGPSTSVALLIAGVSPRRPLDDAYRGFFDLLVRQFAAAIADAQAYEAERARAEALAEIDRSKTTFFSNVSHEFRTPLTLLIGPLEEALSRPQEGLKGDALDSAHRNALRLLRLVNTLLDFSRIEAGRSQARYAPTDLAAATQDLASVFRAAMTHAGLRYSVTCHPLPELVFVDRDMWEKIVLNLVSNAFKYTLHGEVRVELSSGDSGAELVVADTGTGIPSEALPHLFDRFYRVPGAHGRTHEGSGIGLSLVRELVKLHGGSIDVESQVGHGSVFRVRVPYGSTHLPTSQIIETRDPPAGSSVAHAFIEEAERWLPEPRVGQNSSLPAHASAVPASSQSDWRKPTVLLVDDNRDMRDYVSRLLTSRFRVVAAEDGERALALIDSGIRPDVVLSDVMMPRLDGFGLLKSLRARSLTQDLPVIFLSARAGEEARIEGFDVGADDYLVKPFSARELVTRVETHVRLNQLRRSTVELVKVSEERLRLAIEEAGMGTWDLDLRTNQARWSRSHYELLGYSPPSDMSQLATFDMWINRVHPEDLTSVQNALMNARDTQTLYSQEYRIIRADTGAVRWLRALGRFLYDDSGVPVRSVGVDFDDTDRKTAEIALRDADHRKDVFLATLAHELRNPLAPIRNAAQMLGSATVAPEQLQWAQAVIQRQVKHMALLLDDLLDIARITRGKLELKRSRVTLNSVIDLAVEAARPLLDSKSHEFIVTLPAAVVTLDADPMRLSQVVSNLLTNAAKYTDAGGHITLSGRVEGNVLLLSVKDDGIGIPAEALAGIFGMFAQVESAAARSEGGLGIGLALVYGLTELHGGTVEAHSDGSGHGSEFIVKLPIVTVDAATAVSSETPTASSIGRRILVADDNRDAADSLAMILEMAGHDVRVVHDGRSALSVAHSFRPDAVLLDIGMPQLNGYEVARALRQEPWGPDLVLVALTGWGQESDRQQAADAGFDRHFTKPVDPDALEVFLATEAKVAHGNGRSRTDAVQIN